MSKIGKIVHALVPTSDATSTSLAPRGAQTLAREDRHLTVIGSDGIARNITIAELFGEEYGSESIWSVMIGLERANTLLGEAEVARLSQLPSSALDMLKELYGNNEIRGHQYFTTLAGSPSPEVMRTKLEAISPDWKERILGELRMGLGEWIASTRYVEERKRAGKTVDNENDRAMCATTALDFTTALSEQDFNFLSQILSEIPATSDRRLRDELLERAKNSLKARLRKVLL